MLQVVHVTGSNKRCAQRLPSGRKVRVVVRRHGIVAPPQWAVVIDYSTEGIGLSYPGILFKGDEVFLLPNDDLMAPVRYLYTVVHARQISQNESMVGASFTRLERGLQKNAVTVA